MVSVPVLLLFAPRAIDALPAVTFPVMVKVPDDVLFTAPKTVVLATLAPVIFPTIIAVAGDAAVN
jgi:hypothetical protein